MIEITKVSSRDPQLWISAQITPLLAKAHKDFGGWFSVVGDVSSAIFSAI